MKKNIIDLIRSVNLRVYDKLESLKARYKLDVCRTLGMIKRSFTNKDSHTMINSNTAYKCGTNF